MFPDLFSSICNATKQLLRDQAPFSFFRTAGNPFFLQISIPVFSPHPCVHFPLVVSIPPLHLLRAPVGQTPRERGGEALGALIVTKEAKVPLGQRCLRRMPPRCLPSCRISRPPSQWSALSFAPRCMAIPVAFPRVGRQKDPHTS